MHNPLDRPVYVQLVFQECPHGSVVTWNRTIQHVVVMCPHVIHGEDVKFYLWTDVYDSEEGVNLNRVYTAKSILVSECAYTIRMWRDALREVATQLPYTSLRDHARYGELQLHHLRLHFTLMPGKLEPYSIRLLAPNTDGRFDMLEECTFEAGHTRAINYAYEGLCQLVNEPYDRFVASTEPKEQSFHGLERHQPLVAAIAAEMGLDIKVRDHPHFPRPSVEFYFIGTDGQRNALFETAKNRDQEVEFD